MMPAVAGLCLAAIAANPVAAHTRHHHAVAHQAAAPAVDASSSTGFGPTAPGASTILVDAQSGAVLSAQGADTPRYPASLTKLMTLDLAFQALRDGRMTMDTQIPVSSHASAVEPVKLGLRPGNTISVHDAILAMTTMSANDAATALGEYLGGGSEARCAQMMTLRAHALGMAQTQFYNASGLPNPGQVTTARDLALLARDIVTTYPEDQQFFEVQSFNFHGRQVYSNNNMLKSYPGATGMKTGYTNLARHNLVTSAVRNGHVLIGVVLHEPSWGTTYTQMTAMLDSGFGGHIAAASTQVAAAQPQRQAPVRTAASHQTHTAAPLAVASRAHPTQLGGWVAQLGVYTHMAKARTVAIAAHEMRGAGVARIARVEHNGHTLWTAQLAGLTSSTARQTCNALTARGTSCRVIPPAADHLAMLTNDDGT
ncbi:MAG: D-alanyl-D-alanine carboxypeptidase [Acidocella sp.]|nr:D-alanyl-D-alanine carboxypeptidase [Acidocella sp.]